MEYSAFTFVSTLSAYEQVAASFGTRILPILRPPDKQREHRWKKVLHWYGLTEIRAEGVSPEAAMPVHCLSPGCWVVSLNRCVDSVARAFAAMTSSRFVGCNSKTRDTYYKAAGAPRIVFVGMPDDVSTLRLRQLNRVGTRCAFLTAWDLCGLTFVAAKAASARVSPVALCSVVDMERGEAFTIKGGKPISRRSHTQLTALPRFVGRSHQALVIRAHGEGGHVTLNSVVLCGLFGDHERQSDGSPVHGCSVRNAVRLCKRVHDRRVHVVPFSKLKTARLALLTCLGAAMPDDLQGTNISAILDCLDGYPHTVITTTAVTQIHENGPEIVASLLGQGIAAADIRVLLDDLHERAFGSYPFVVFGNDNGLPIEWLKPHKGTVVTVPAAQSVVAVKWDPPVAPGVVQISCDQKVIATGNGKRYCVIVCDSSPNSAKVSITDSSRCLSRAVEHFTQLMAKAERSGFWLRAIGTYYKEALRSSRQFLSRYRNLCEIRGAIERSAQSGLRACSVRRDAGNWDDSLEYFERLSAIDVRGWDRCFAIMAAEHLFDGALERILSDGHEVLSRVIQDQCDACNSRMWEVKSHSRTTALPPLTSVHCPTCGHRESRTQESHVVAYKLPARLVAGSKIAVELDPAGGAGMVAVEFRDKASNKVFYRRVLPHNAGKLSFGIVVPDEIYAEMHTIRVVWCCELDLTFMRLRRPS